MSKKILYCIRHGTALHNTLFKTMGSKAYTSYRDTALTEQGIVDAMSLNKTWDELKDIELVLVSPLSRTLHTASIIFKDHPAPVIVLDCLKEYPQSSQIINYRHNISSLEKIYPRFNFSNIKSDQDIEWINKELPKVTEIEKLKKRIETFKHWVHAQSQDKIAVVGHSSYLNMMINGYVDTEITELQHCFPYIYKL